MSQLNLHDISKSNVQTQDNNQIPTGTRANDTPSVEGKKDESNEKKEVTIKKNLLNPTAGIFYSLGLSITHIALGVAQYFVRQPSSDNIVHPACIREYNDLASLYWQF